MELRQIRYFIAIAETKSMTKAEERLHVAQPALSHSLRKLEEELETELFSRSRKGMELTDTGAAFLEHAYTISQQVARAEESTRAVDSDPHGVVSVAVSSSVANVLVVPLIHRLRKKFPNIGLNLEEGLTGSLRHSFDNGLFDLMIEFDVEQQDGLSVEPLIREELYLITPFKKGPHGKKDIDFEELQRFDLITPRRQHGMGKTVHRFAQLKNVELSTAANTIALHPALKLVEAGIYNSILPWSAVYELVEREAVSARKIINPSMERTASLIRHVGMPKVSAVSKAIDVILDSVKQVHAEDKWRGELLID